ncbi:hypothetical protein AB751O23_AB_00010, partial [Chlamydiales bacterium SCGC AB-751-O23]
MSTKVTESRVVPRAVPVTIGKKRAVPVIIDLARAAMPSAIPVTIGQSGGSLRAVPVEINPRALAGAVNFENFVNGLSGNVTREKNCLLKRKRLPGDA